MSGRSKKLFVHLFLLPAFLGTVSIPGCLVWNKEEPVAPVKEEIVDVAVELMIEKDLESVDSKILSIDSQTLREVLKTKIDENSLRAILEDASLIVVDVRDFDSYSRCRIRGSVNIPLGEISGEAKDWDRAKKIVIYSAGRGCKLSKKGARRLVIDGFGKVFEYEGGIAEWKKLAFELDGPEGEKL